MTRFVASSRCRRVAVRGRAWNRGAGLAGRRAEHGRWLQLDDDLFNALDQNGATTIAVASGRAFAISVIVPPRFARSGVTYGSNRQAAHDRTGGGDRQMCRLHVHGHAAAVNRGSNASV
jgi:hypothetical protein